MIRPKIISQLLFLLAFVIELFTNGYLVTLSAIMIATFALFLFTKSLRIGSRVLRRSLPRQEQFTAVACSFVFFLSNVASKVLFRILAEADVTSTILVFLSFIVLASVLYLILKFAAKRTGYQAWDRHAEDASLPDRDKYKRVTNALILLSALAGADGADLMYVLAITASFLSEMYILANIILRTVRSIIELFARICRSDFKHWHSGSNRHSRRTKLADLDEYFWNKAFVIVEYRRGLPFMLVSFVAALPMIMLSQAIDLRHLEWKYVLVLGVFVAPSLASFWAIYNPKKAARSHGRDSKILAVAFMAPFLASAFVSVRPDLMPPLTTSTDVTEQLRITLCAATTLPFLPLAFGFPLFKMIESSDANDCDGFVRWSRIFGYSIFPLLVPGVVVSLAFYPFELAFADRLRLEPEELL